MNNTRLKKACINSVVTLVTQFIQILLGFLIRKIFIDYLGVTYLGYNSVFVNILQMLNLADMGIGVAITSYLYKPLADKDSKRITAIMAIYKRLYSLLGIVVLGVGLLVSVFLDMLIPDATCGIWFLRMLFYINLAGTVSTYFLAYKRTLLIADQKAYTTNIIDTLTFFVISILQILSLITYPNYLIYLSLSIIKNVLSNIIISIKVNKDYKYLNQKPDTLLIDEYKPQIAQYVKNVFISRIGAVVYYSTDNIILSVLKGSLLTGFLSNYTLITGQLNTVVTQVLSSLQATFGNFINTTSDKTARMKMTDNYFCVNFCIGNFCFICFTLLVQSFILLLYGSNMLLTTSTAMWLGINLLLTFLLQLPSQVFVIYKLFRFDRPIIIVSAVLNIMISIILVKYLGINGVLIGTFLTSLIYLFSRFYIISKYVYNVKFWYYVKRILYYAVISLITFAISSFTSKKVYGDGLFWFAVRVIIVVMLSVNTTAFLLSFSNEFEFLKNKLLPGKLKKYASKGVIGIGCVIIIISSIFIGGRTKQIDFSTSGNKSYSRNDTYISELDTGNNLFHLSFDDTILIFKDIKENKYNSIFQNSTLSWFQELHNKYGIVISCYVYYEDGDFNLSQFTSEYQEEFIQNSDWLRFGFHSLNGNTNYETGDIAEDYVKTIKELKRIVGKEAIDNVVRLQMFKGTYEGILELSEINDEPIQGLLTADDKRQSYYLQNKENTYIYAHDVLYDYETNLYFYSTDFRIEYIDNINSKLIELSQDSWNNQTGDLVVFTHEWALNGNNKQKVERLCKYAQDKGYRFLFFEDVSKQN